MYSPGEIKNDFPILAQDIDGKPLIYLDNAATTQKPSQVLDAIHDYYTSSNSNVGRSVYTLSMRASEAFDQAREKVRQHINAKHSHEIIFTKGTTESVNQVATVYGPQVVGAGDEVLITGMEHHSNLLPWQVLCAQTGARLRTVPLDDRGAVNMKAFREEINERTKMIAIAHISNVLGTINPVKEMIAEAHRHGIRVLIDAAQSIAHAKVDVQDLDADFLCFSGHKMYGPMGIGVLYAEESLLEQMSPYQVGGGIATDVGWQEVRKYKPTPFRFEAGTPNIAGAVGLAAAIDYLNDIGYDWIIEHERGLLDYALEKLQQVDGMEIIGTSQPKGGIISFNIEGLHPYDIGNHANAHGIAMRTGVHCAVPLMDDLGFVGTVRASFGVYNTSEDVDALYAALQTVQAGVWTKERANLRFL